MKVRDILGAGLERRFRGPRKPRNKQIGFHKRMKDLIDSAIKEDAKEGGLFSYLETYLDVTGGVNTLFISKIVNILLSYF